MITTPRRLAAACNFVAVCQADAGRMTDHHVGSARPCNLSATRFCGLPCPDKKGPGDFRRRALPSPSRTAEAVDLTLPGA